MPNGEELDNVAKEYVKKIHYFDCRHGDRCISYWGLEGRVPLLDPEVIEAYWELPEWDILNIRVLKNGSSERLWWIGFTTRWSTMEKKEAFSDGVSSKERSWYEIIQEDCEKNITRNDGTI